MRKSNFALSFDLLRRLGSWPNPKAWRLTTHQRGGCREALGAPN